MVHMYLNGLNKEWWTYMQLVFKELINEWRRNCKLFWHSTQHELVRDV